MVMSYVASQVVTSLDAFSTDLSLSSAPEKLIIRYRKSRRPRTRRMMTRGGNPNRKKNQFFFRQIENTLLNKHHAFRGMRMEGR